MSKLEFEMLAPLRERRIMDNCLVRYNVLNFEEVAQNQTFYIL